MSSRRSDPQKGTAMQMSRWAFARRVYGRPIVLLVLGIYNGLQLVSNLISWTTSTDTQQKYQFIKLAQAWSMRTWIIGLLLILLVITFEGAFRVMFAHKLAERAQMATCQAKVDALEEELTPKLDIIFRPEFPFLYKDTSFGFDEIRIGVRNDSGRELSRVKLQLDDLLLGTKLYNSLPLHVTRTKRRYKYPYETEFALNPGDMEYLDLAMSLPDRSWGSFSYSGGAPDQIEKGRSYEFIITATASEGRPLRRRALLTVDISPPFTLTLKEEVVDGSFVELMSRRSV